MLRSHLIESFSSGQSPDIFDQAISTSHYLIHEAEYVHPARFVGGYLRSFADRMSVLSDELAHRGESDSDSASKRLELAFLLESHQTHRSVLPGVSVRCRADEPDLTQMDSPLSRYEKRVAYGYQQLFSAVFFSTHPSDVATRNSICENIQAHPGWELLVKYVAQNHQTNYDDVSQFFVTTQKFIYSSPLGDLISDLTQLHHFDDDYQASGLSLETINIGKDDATNTRQVFDNLCQEIRTLLSQPIFGVESIGDHPRLQQIMNEVMQLRKVVQKAVV